MKKSILHEALTTARAKISNHPEFTNFIHFSFIVQNNQLVEYGRNSKRIPSVHYGYAKRLIDAKYGPKTHAEMDAYRKAKGLLKGKPFEIINIRLNKRSEVRLSKPCVCCYALLKELGCKCFYFSSRVGFLKILIS